MLPPPRRHLPPPGLRVLERLARRRQFHRHGRLHPCSHALPRRRLGGFLEFHRRLRFRHRRRQDHRQGHGPHRNGGRESPPRWPPRRHHLEHYYPYPRFAHEFFSRAHGRLRRSRGPPRPLPRPPSSPVAQNLLFSFFL